MWLIVAILSYFILACVFLLDKYLLVQRIPSPKIYVFYVGLFSALALFLVPFVDFYAPEGRIIFLSLLTGAVFILALLAFFKALLVFEASRIVPLVGAILPVFTLISIYLFSGGKETLGSFEFLAFFLLIIGSVLITHEEKKGISWQSFRFSLLAAFLFAVYFSLLKYIYLILPFWTGLIWTRMGSFLMALFFFLGFEEIRKKVLFKKPLSLKLISSKQIITPFLFILTRVGAGVAGLLQLWAVFLVPPAKVAIINALQGTQYLFLLLLVVFLSLRFPQILEEEISKIILFKKFLAIGFILSGLAILAFFNDRL